MSRLAFYSFAARVVMALTSVFWALLWFWCAVRLLFSVFFFQAEDGIRDWSVTGVQTCALPIYSTSASPVRAGLVERAQDWRWSSASASGGVERPPLHPGPVPRPAAWLEHVN